MNIRESLKQKFNNWVDQRCDKGEETYNQTLDDCPDDKYDWRDMLIEELLDGLQYQEKEIKRLKKEIKIHKGAVNKLFTWSKPKPSPFEIYEYTKAPYADLDD